MRAPSPAAAKRLARGAFIRRPRAWRAGEHDARIAREPQRDRDLALRPGRQRLLAQHLEAGRSIHCVTVSAAKPSRRWACSSRRNSRSCGAKSTTSSRPPGRSTRAASRMARRAVVEEVQHLVDDDDVEGIARQRQVVDVALAHAAILEAGAVEPARASASMSSDRSRPRPRSISRREQFEHAPGAGAEIEQRADRLVGERSADLGLDRLIGHVQLADAVPFGGVAAEIVLRRGGAGARARRRAVRGRGR